MFLSTLLTLLAWLPFVQLSSRRGSPPCAFLFRLHESFIREELADKSLESVFDKWKIYPECLHFLASDKCSFFVKGHSILELLQDRGGEDIKLLYEYRLLQKLEGWESLHWEVFKPLIEHPEFDINEIPWYKLSEELLYQVTYQIAEGLLKPIQIMMGNDHFLKQLLEFDSISYHHYFKALIPEDQVVKLPNYIQLLKRALYNSHDSQDILFDSLLSAQDHDDEDLVNLGVNNICNDIDFDINGYPWFFLHPETLESLMECAMRPIKITATLDLQITMYYIEYASRQGSTLWKGLYVDDFDTGNFINYTLLYEKVGENLDKSDENLIHFYYLTGPFMRLYMNYLFHGEIEVDLNVIPWYFLSDDVLEGIFEFIDMPIIIDAASDLYLKGRDYKIIWDAFYPTEKARNIPNYTKMMADIGQLSIKYPSHVDAIYWSILTGHIDIDSEIVQVKWDLNEFYNNWEFNDFHPYLRHDSLGQQVFIKDNEEEYSVNEGYLLGELARMAFVDMFPVQRHVIIQTLCELYPTAATQMIHSHPKSLNSFLVYVNVDGNKYIPSVAKVIRKSLFYIRNFKSLNVEETEDLKRFIESHFGLSDLTWHWFVQMYIVQTHFEGNSLAMGIATNLASKMPSLQLLGNAFQKYQYKSEYSDGIIYLTRFIGMDREDINEIFQNPSTVFRLIEILYRRDNKDIEALRLFIRYALLTRLVRPSQIFKMIYHQRALLDDDAFFQSQEFLSILIFTTIINPADVMATIFWYLQYRMHHYGKGNVQVKTLDMTLLGAFDGFVSVTLDPAFEESIPDPHRTIHRRLPLDCIVQIQTHDGFYIDLDSSMASFCTTIVDPITDLKDQDKTLPLPCEYTATSLWIVGLYLHSLRDGTNLDWATYTHRLTTRELFNLLKLVGFLGIVAP